MSRIGKIPIDIPSGVNIEIDGNKVSVKGKLGELSQELGDQVLLAIEENKLVLTRKSDDKPGRSQHGLYRSLLNNMVKGVNEGFEKSLDIIGVGYRASKKGNDLEILIGYSNPVTVKAVEGIIFDLPNQNLIIVRGIDKQKVGEVANMIRSIRKPEPYKGKGIKYRDEVIRRKVGKTTAAGGKAGGKK